MSQILCPWLLAQGHAPTTCPECAPKVAPELLMALQKLAVASCWCDFNANSLRHDHSEVCKFAISAVMKAEKKEGDTMTRCQHCNDPLVWHPNGGWRHQDGALHKQREVNCTRCAGSGRFDTLGPVRLCDFCQGSGRVIDEHGAMPVQEEAKP